MADSDSAHDSDASGPPPGTVITHLQSAQQQVGGHVIHALQQPGTVAVITTVVPTPHGQSIVSVGLDQATLEQVRDLLSRSSAEDLPRVPCVGFHCFLSPRDLPGVSAVEQEDEDADTVQRDFP